MIGFVSVEDYNIIGMGESKQEAYKNYKEALESEGNDITISQNEDLENIQGTVSRINQDVKGGNTTYYIMLKENNKLIFTATSKISAEIPLTEIGDKVDIYYDKTNSNIISISEFDNKNIGQKEETSDNNSSKKDTTADEKSVENNDNNKTKDTK